jgi:hypothetical protein
VIGLFPWCLFLPLKKSDVAVERRRESARTFLLAWVGVVFVFFTVSHSKLPFYILPLFPALSLLIALFLMGASARELIVRLWGLATLLLCFYAFAEFGAPLAGSAAKSALMVHAMHTLAMASLPILVATVLGIAFTHAGHRHAMVWLMALASLAGWQTALQSYAADQDFNTAKSAADLLWPSVDAQTKVFTFERNLRGLPFYLSHNVIIVGHADDDISPTVSSNPAGYLADTAQFAALWQRSDNAVALIPTEDMPLLDQQGMPYYVLGKTPSLVAVSRTLPKDAR